MVVALFKFMHGSTVPLLADKAIIRGGTIYDILQHCTRPPYPQGAIHGGWWRIEFEIGFHTHGCAFMLDIAQYFY